MPDRINVIRSLFEGLNLVSPVLEGTAQSKGHRGFSGGLMGGGNEQMGHIAILFVSKQKADNFCRLFVILPG
jgi:hypothetical protein